MQRGPEAGNSRGDGHGAGGSTERHADISGVSRRALALHVGGEHGSERADWDASRRRREEGTGTRGTRGWVVPAEGAQRGRQVSGGDGGGEEAEGVAGAGGGGEGQGSDGPESDSYVGEDARREALGLWQGGEAEDANSNISRGGQGGAEERLGRVEGGARLPQQDRSQRDPGWAAEGVVGGWLDARATEAEKGT